jgi:hypothetical protein
LNQAPDLGEAVAARANGAAAAKEGQH